MALKRIVNLPDSSHFLVIGASGLIGQRVLHRVGPERATGTYHRRSFSAGTPFDLAKDEIGDVIAQMGRRFTHGLILGGIVNIDECARNTSESTAVNVLGVIRTIEGLLRHDIVPIFASSDAVYDGRRGNWRESDPAEPIITYGRQKLEVERYLLRRGLPFIALRIANILDPDLAQSGVLGPWIRCLAEGEVIACATDQRFCPLGLDDVVTAICQLAKKGANGVFNLGGGEPISRIELLEMLAAATARHRTIKPVIKRCSLRDFPFLESRPLDLTLSIEKLRAATTYRPESLAAICERAARKTLESRN
jgi:dTDP-4-dehydrorhamnose reductase